MFLAMTSYLVFAVTGMLISRPFFTLQTSSAVIAEEGFQYMWIVSVFGIGLFLQTMNEKILASTGRTNLTMVSQLAGAAINIVLDPIMIFGLFGFPALGVAGAAIATVTAVSWGCGSTAASTGRSRSGFGVSGLTGESSGTFTVWVCRPSSCSPSAAS
nr:polysaccharide biosynthesis C-terminal domain-containing protein [Faecalibaculum rodentium]